VPKKAVAIVEPVEDDEVQDAESPDSRLQTVSHSEPRMTTDEVIEFLKDYSPFGDENDPYEMLNKFLKKDWTFRVVNTTQAKSFSHLIIAGELTIRVKDDVYAGLTRSGLAIVPMTYPYQDMLEIGIRNALLNALQQLGAQVEYAEFEEQEPAAPAAAKQTSAPPANVKKFAKKSSSDDEEDDDTVCGDCGNPIESYVSSKGKDVSIATQIRMTKGDYGVALCKRCSGRRWARANR
jgi:hypothetical protein